MLGCALFSIYTDDIFLHSFLFNFQVSYNFMFVFRPHLDILKAYSWVWTQGSLLVGFLGLYRVSGLNPGWSHARQAPNLYYLSGLSIYFLKNYGKMVTSYFKGIFIVKSTHQKYTNLLQVKSLTPINTINWTIYNNKYNKTLFDTHKDHRTALDGWHKS